MAVIGICVWLAEFTCRVMPGREHYILTQLSHFGGEIAIFKNFFPRCVSKSPKMLKNPVW